MSGSVFLMTIGAVEDLEKIQLRKERRREKRIRTRTAPVSSPHRKVTHKYYSNLLLAAARDGNERLVNRLLSKKADVNARDENGNTPLMLATTNDHYGVVEDLVEKHNADIFLENRYENTALTITGENFDNKSHLEIIACLFKQYDSFKRLDFADARDAFMVHGRPDLVACCFLNESRSMDHTEKYDDNEYYYSNLLAYFCYFASIGDSDCTEPVRSQRQDYLELIFQEIRTIQQRHPRIPKDSDIIKTGWGYEERELTILIPAAYHGNLDMVESLVEDYNEDVNAAGQYGDTALMAAAKEGHLAVVEYLTKRRANVDAQNKNNCTALMLAAEGNHLAIVRHLVEKRDAKIGTRDYSGKTALTYATEKDHAEIVDYLKKCLDKLAAARNLTEKRNTHADVQNYSNEYCNKRATIKRQIIFGIVCSLILSVAILVYKNKIHRNNKISPTNRLRKFFFPLKKWTRTIFYSAMHRLTA